MGVSLKHILLGVLSVVLLVSMVGSFRSTTVETTVAAKTLMEVEVMELKKEDFQVKIYSDGTVSARDRVELVTELTGRVVSVSEVLQIGSAFEEGQLLVELESRDFEAAVTIAAADLARAKTEIAEEQARAAQAKESWLSSRRNSTPSDLALRKPQLAQARAKLAAARANLRKAERNLNRTLIRAPFSGKVVSSSVTKGQYVRPGDVLADIFAVDYAEVHLPVNSKEFEFLDILVSESENGFLEELHQEASVVINTTVGSRKIPWKAKLVHVEEQLDPLTRQLMVVAQIKNPFVAREDGAPRLRLGMYVEAEIEGELLRAVYAIPKTALYDDTTVLVLDSKNRIHKRALEVAWEDSDTVVVRHGLSEGERVVVSGVKWLVLGAQVEVVAVSDSRQDKESLSRG